MPELPQIDERLIANKSDIESTTKLSVTKFSLPFDNFYQTCPISRASETMARCVEAFVSKTKKLEVA
jgi:hypothetical protein